MEGKKKEPRLPKKQRHLAVLDRELDLLAAPVPFPKSPWSAMVATWARIFTILGIEQDMVYGSNLMVHVLFSGYHDLGAM